MFAAVIILAVLLVASLVGCVLLWSSRPKPVEPEIIERPVEVEKEVIKYVDRPVYIDRVVEKVVEREAKPKRVAFKRPKDSRLADLTVTGVGRSRRRYIFNFSDGSVRQLDRMADVQNFAAGAVQKPKTLEETQACLVAEWLTVSLQGSDVRKVMKL